jgi:hypothetical protein
MMPGDVAESLDSVHAQIVSMRPGEIIEAANTIDGIAKAVNTFPSTEMDLLRTKLVRLRRVLGLAESMFGQIAEQFSQDQAAVAAVSTRLEIKA